MPKHQMEVAADQQKINRVTIHTRAAIIEGPDALGPVANPEAVAAAVIQWANTLYESDPQKRAWIDARVLQDPKTNSSKSGSDLAIPELQEAA